MIDKPIRSWLVAGMAAFVLSGCAEMFPEKYRFEVTVEVETPQGLHSGSSVFEVRASNKTALLPEEASRTWGVRGEAVAVDLPNGRTLFALLRTNAKHGDMAGLSMTALDPAFRNDVVESAARIAAGDGVRQQADVAPKDYPMLVTFRDLADPTSVQAASPADFASVFGPGYALRRITVRVTDEPVTSTISEQLRWLGSSPEPRLDRSYRGSTSPSLDQELAHGDFLRGGR